MPVATPLITTPTASRLTSFQDNLLDKSTSWLLRKYITFGEAFVFDNDRSRYFDLRGCTERGIIV